jgi:hypothetical protein
VACVIEPLPRTQARVASIAIIVQGRNRRAAFECPPRRLTYGSSNTVLHYPQANSGGPNVGASSQAVPRDSFSRQVSRGHIAPQRLARTSLRSVTTPSACHGCLQDTVARGPVS